MIHHSRFYFRLRFAPELTLNLKLIMVHFVLMKLSIISFKFQEKYFRSFLHFGNTPDSLLCIMAFSCSSCVPLREPAKSCERRREGYQAS